MRVKLLFDYITKQYEAFVKPEFKDGLKRRNSLTSLSVAESKAETVRMSTQKQCIWEEASYNRSLKALEQYLNTM
jgi:hypothetical protein